MRAITLPSFAILAFIAITGLAGPLTSSHLAARSLEVSNAPPTGVRTSLDGSGSRSDSNALERRIDLVKVNAFPHSAVYILVGLTSKIFEQVVISEVRDLLDGVLAFAMVASEEIGYDKLIPGGMFSSGRSPKLSVWNANNHQVTWNTLHDTVMALLKFMEDNNYGSADFAVYDDKNKVGEGVLATYQ